MAGALTGVTGADPAKLADAKKQFAEKAGAFTAAVGRVNTAVEQVNTSWFGSTNKQFNTNQQLWAENMAKFTKGVQTIGDALGAVGVDYGNLDMPSAAPAA